VIEENFGYKKLHELILMVHEREVTVANAKLIMQLMIDGDKRSPKRIAKEQGFVGETITTEDVIRAVNECLENPANASVIAKIIGGNEKPVMSLVGSVFKQVNRQGDPVVIKKLILDGIAKMDKQLPKEPEAEKEQ